MDSKKIILFLLIFTGLFNLNPCDAQLFNEQGLKFMKLFDLIENQYVDTINKNKLTDEAIKDLLHKLDPHSVYFNKDEVKTMNEPLVGNFEGIGVTYSVFKDTILVISCFTNGPSDKAGVKSGDRIIKINNENVAGVNISKQTIQNKLRGVKGSKVNIDVLRRKSKELLSFEIIRDKVLLTSVDAAYLVDKNTGYIKLSRFSANSFDEVDKILNNFKSHDVENVILDLSGNTGGYLDIAVSLTDEFLEKGKLIVYTSGVHAEKKEYFSTSRGYYEKGKLVIIINENSASASEIVAGAIQDWDRGLLIGRRSYGKGLVQRKFSFPDGSEIRLTTARYYTPTGRLIQKSYTNGYSAYSKELDERTKSGEIFGNNPKVLTDSTKYYTLLKKRIVYGSGGITPDIFVPVDTNQFTKVYRTILKKNIFQSFALDYIDFKRDSLLNKYPDFASYKLNFNITSNLLSNFNHYCESQNIKMISSEFEKSKSEISQTLKAYIAMELWTSSEFYEIYNSLDPDFNKAKEVIKNWEKYSD